MAFVPAEFVAGPRGRRFLLELAYAFCSAEIGRPNWMTTLMDAVAHLENVLRSADLGAIARAGESEVLIALGESVGFARYWQEPDLEDQALADDRLRDALEQVASAAIASPGGRSLQTAVDLDDQVETVTRSDDHPRFTAATSAREALESWRSHVLADESRAARERPVEVTAAWSGEWWSKPWVGGSTIVDTGRRASDGAPVRLRMEEDDYGLAHALARRRRVQPRAAVLELRGPDDWRRLVERWPLEVTASRRHDCWRATGRTTRWFIPDFAAAADAYDGIHLAMAGYLLTAGRPVPVAGGHTLLAGWDPDATYWLSDLPAPDPQVERWTRDPERYWVWRTT